MRKIFFAILLFAIFTLSVFAQERQSANDPILVESFGNINEERLKQNFGHLAQLVLGHPNSIGQILYYGGEKDLIGFRYRHSAFLNAFSQYSLNSQKTIFADKLSFVQCGFEKEFRIEFYVIPNGVKQKKCVEEFKVLMETALFDSISEDSHNHQFDEEEIIASLKILTEYIKRTLESKAFIIINSSRKISVYDEKKDKERNLTTLEIKNLVTKKMQQAENQIIGNGIEPARIEIFTGKSQKDEYGDFIWKLWIVPKGGEIPQEVAAYLKRRKPAKKR